MARITQLYIGLETKNGKTLDPRQVIDLISKRVDAGTFHETKGLWRGELEDSIMFECVDIENHADVTIAELQQELADAFDQDSVMVKQFDAELRF